jgi:hypothetical protein
MPLLDHFHPLLRSERRWESFHAAWSVEIMSALNRNVLPKGYFAEAQAHIGHQVEIDVASFESETEATEAASANGGVAVQTWAPPATALVMPVVFPDDIEVQVYEESGGPTLVAAIELVSPGNKDRAENRRAFAAKCAAHLHRGIGLVVVDVVTNRMANLHDELIDLLRQAESYRFPSQATIYTTAYRPRRAEEDGQVEIWLETLAVDGALPTMPLALRGGPTLPVPLESTYTEARLRSRL